LKELLKSPGELVSVTVKKEFGEEALNTLEMTEAEKAEMSKMVEKFLSDGDEVCLFEEISRWLPSLLQRFLWYLVLLLQIHVEHHFPSIHFTLNKRANF
jgi:hypothetical protein